MVGDELSLYVSLFLLFFPLFHMELSQISPSTVRVLTSCSMESIIAAMPRLDSVCSFPHSGEHHTHCLCQEHQWLGDPDMLVFTLTTSLGNLTSSLSHQFLHLLGTKWICSTVSFINEWMWVWLGTWILMAPLAPFDDSGHHFSFRKMKGFFSALANKMAYQLENSFL